MQFPNGARMVPNHRDTGPSWIRHMVEVLDDHARPPEECPICTPESDPDAQEMTEQDRANERIVMRWHGVTWDPDIVF